MKTKTKEKPILFSTAMIKSILAGNKTMTRRLAKEPIQISENTKFYNLADCKYKVDDILYVKESYLTNKDKVFMGYKADATKSQLEMTENKNIVTAKWSNPRFFEKKYARIYLKVIGVKVEELQDISEDDAMKEGFVKYDDKTPPIFGDMGSTCLGFAYSARQAFSFYWNDLYSKKPDCQWRIDKELWVYVIEFEVLKDYIL